MAEGSNDDALMKSLAHLKRRALDVKFDLDTTEYVPQENIGIGAYGVVCSAIHKKTNDKVAIKKIPSVFDVKDVAKRTYREIKILKHFKHDNIIHIREILKPKCSVDDFKDVYVVFDLMESDLHRIIYSKQELSEEHVRYFLYQILRGLKYIHSAHVVHRDLKPSNLLVNEDCQLRIGDFGMSRGVSSSPQEPNYFMTQYVATRWFRAPEIMLSLVEYGTAVDMWSVGCIFAEMLGRKPLFPGKDYISQIRLIVGVVGSPKEDLLQMCHSPIIKNYFKELGHKDPVPWPKLFPNASKKAINLLSRMLVLNPKERLTVEQALVYPYLNKYHDPDDEPICVPTFNFDFEKEDMSIPQIREAIYQEAMEYHQPRTPTFSFNAFLRPVPKSSGDKPPDSGSLLIPKQEAGLNDTDDKERTAQQIREKSEETSKPVPALKSGEGEMFKKPLSAKNDDSQVRIDTSNLLKVESQDVEMLSAKSTDGNQLIVAEEKPKENREPGRGNKQMISQDTKALVKAALLNANLRKQRLDSVGEDEKSKPVTAAMRQREREEKRKKKKEKTAERKRKEKIKKGKEKEELLTSEDKELLMRWVKMQKVNVPIAPKPEIGVKGDTVVVSHKLKQANLNFRPGVAVNSAVAANGPVKSHTVNTGGQGYALQGHSASVTGEGQGSKNVTQMFGRTVHKGPAAHQDTISLLQQHLRSQGQTEKDEGQRSVQNSDRVTSAKQIITQQAPGLSETVNETSEVKEGETSQRTNLLEGPKSSSDYSVDFSTVNLGDLDFLTMISTPKSVSEMNYSIADTNCSYTSVTSVNESQSLPKIEVVSDVPNSQDLPSGGFLQKLCSESTNTQGFPPNTDGHNFPTHSCQQSVSPSRISPNLQPTPPQWFQPNADHQSFPPQPGQQSVSPNHISPISQSANQRFFNNPSPQNVSPNHLTYSPEGSTSVHQPQLGSHSPEAVRSVSPNRVSPNQVSPTLVGHQYDPSGTHIGFSVSQSFLQNAASTAAFTSSHFPVNPSINTSNLHPHQGFNPISISSANQHQSQVPASQMNSEGSVPFTNYSQSQGIEEDTSSSAKSKFEMVPGLFVNTKQAQMPYRQLFQNAVPGPSGITSHTGNHSQDPQLDLVALAKQLSKSNMEDLCPTLALTPKGTGGGYGVGVDVDSLMMVSQDGEGPLPEPSPLSSSILADWMEVTGNMNIDMDALEQELQSPMALSYNDFNLYSS